MNILTTIVAKKTEKLNAAKVSLPQSKLKERIKCIDKTRDFRGAIQRHEGPIRLIAEIKKASPSKGLIRSNFDPVIIASIYDSKPVNALSVLTEEDYFQGQLSYISQVKDITIKPVLRKDFIVDEYQLYESRACGADAVLLIASVLEQSQAGEYLHLAEELGLTVLFEVHNEEELEKALRVDAEIIGINNRNLKTLSIDLSTTLRLKKEVPAGKVVVSESGIRTRQDVLMLQDNGIDAMLIGTSLMETPDIGRKIDELLSL